MSTTYPSIQQYAQLVELKDYRPATKKEYVRMIRRLADHVQCDPATLSENQVRQYFLFLRQEKKFGRSAMTIAKAALRGFFCEQLKVPGWTVFNELRIAWFSTRPLLRMARASGQPTPPTHLRAPGLDSACAFAARSLATAAVPAMQDTDDQDRHHSASASVNVFKTSKSQTRIPPRGQIPLVAPQLFCPGLFLKGLPLDCSFQIRPAARESSTAFPAGPANGASALQSARQIPHLTPHLTQNRKGN
jgi:hypothetical protein